MLYNWIISKLLSWATIANQEHFYFWYKVEIAIVQLWQSFSNMCEMTMAGTIIWLLKTNMKAYGIGNLIINNTGAIEAIWLKENKLHSNQHKPSIMTLCIYIFSFIKSWVCYIIYNSICFAYVIFDNYVNCSNIHILSMITQSRKNNHSRMLVFSLGVPFINWFWR